ncbi:MAG: hypothetical protein PHP00_06455 [Thiotrichaceae bacterium]|nr:hypothetical protein [Thiotrichaceae bacterium]
MSHQQIIELKQSLLDAMLDYMNYGGATDENDPDYDPEFDAGYSAQDVATCGEIIDNFLKQLKNTGTDKTAIMQAVKVAVLELNALNENCEHGLIETEQREQLYEIISAAAMDAGLEIGEEEDITGEWREW